MRFNHKQPLIVLAIVGILFLPALLFYWFGFPFIAKLSLVFMAAGILVTLSQFLSYYKIDYQKKKFLITHGWFYPEELESIPFEDITRLSIGFLNKEDKRYFLFFDSKDSTSISLFSSKHLDPLRAKAEKIAGLMKKPVVDETHWTNPVRRMNKFPNGCSIQVYLLMGYTFVLFPLFLIIAVMGTVVISSAEVRRARETAIDDLYEYYQPVIDQAEKLVFQCAELKQGYISGKIAIRLPKSFYKEDWSLMLPDRYKPNDIREVNTVVLVDSFEHDWGTSSGTIVLLRERKKFHFYVTSGRSEKRLGSTIRADGYLIEYLINLPAH